MKNKEQTTNPEQKVQLTMSSKEFEEMASKIFSDIYLLNGRLSYLRKLSQLNVDIPNQTKELSQCLVSSQIVAAEMGNLFAKFYQVQDSSKPGQTGESNLAESQNKSRGLRAESSILEGFLTEEYCTSRQVNTIHTANQDTSSETITSDIENEEYWTFVDEANKYIEARRHYVDKDIEKSLSTESEG